MSSSNKPGPFQRAAAAALFAHGLAGAPGNIIHGQTPRENLQQAQDLENERRKAEAARRQNNTHSSSSPPKR